MIQLLCIPHTTRRPHHVQTRWVKSETPMIGWIDGPAPLGLHATPRPAALSNRMTTHCQQLTRRSRQLVSSLLLRQYCDLAFSLRSCRQRDIACFAWRHATACWEVRTKALLHTAPWNPDQAPSWPTNCAAGSHAPGLLRTTRQLQRSPSYLQVHLDS